MHANLIGGRWVEGADEVADVSPSDLADVVGTFAVADEAAVDDAIGAAADAAPAWAAATPQERFTALEAVGLELEARAAELGEQLSREEGKPRAEGVGEVQRAAQIFRFFAGEALRVPGEHVRSVRPGVDVDVLREPLGVVGIITPWNFPIAIPAWKIAPALAFGCAVVCKPAELVPASAWALAEIVSRAGLPDGAFNLVVGPGRVVGERDPRRSAGPRRLLHRVAGGRGPCGRTDGVALRPVSAGDGRQEPARRSWTTPTSTLPSTAQPRERSSRPGNGAPRPAG